MKTELMFAERISLRCRVRTRMKHREPKTESSVERLCAGAVQGSVVSYKRAALEVQERMGIDDVGAQLRLDERLDRPHRLGRQRGAHGPPHAGDVRQERCR